MILNKYKCYKYSNHYETKFSIFTFQFLCYKVLTNGYPVLEIVPLPFKGGRLGLDY